MGAVEQLCGAGQMVPMGDGRVFGAVGDSATEVIPEFFHCSFSFASDAFRILLVAESFGAVVAVFLKGFHLCGDAAEHGNAALIFRWI